MLTVYLLVIRRVAEALGRLDSGFRVEVVEAVLISLLIFLFQPIKNRLQGIINRLFFRAEIRISAFAGFAESNAECAARAGEAVEGGGGCGRCGVESACCFPGGV